MTARFVIRIGVTSFLRSMFTLTSIGSPAQHRILSNSAVRQTLYAFVLLGATIGTASAQHTPEDVIRYRQSAMTLMNWNARVLAAMVKGNMPFDKSEFAKHADRLASLAPQVFEGFVARSESGAVTDAKPDIWVHFDDFKIKLQDLLR